VVCEREGKEGRKCDNKLSETASVGVRKARKKKEQLREQTEGGKEGGGKKKKV